MNTTPVTRVVYSTLLISLACLANRTTSAEETKPLAAGELRSFVASGESGITYHLQVPRSFTSENKRPLLIVFSPGGNGQRLVERLRESVDDAGWMLVGCDVLRNGMQDTSEERKLEDEVLDDIFRTIPHDPDRVYLGGFSGGAWRAYHLTTRRSEPYAGIVALGGWLGGADSQEEAYREGMSIAMINGLNDNGANGWMPIDTASLRNRNCIIKHFAFEGGHSVAPPAVTSAAIRWLDQQWASGKRETPAEALGKQRLNVLYVGNPGQRADDFTSFLREHFETVHQTAPADLTLQKSNEADVLLIDATVRSLPEGCTKAMVMIGSSAALTGERYGSKIDWLCLCLDNEAYHINTAHQIFSSPIPVTPSLVEKTCPHAKLEIQAWKVHDETDAPGLVASRRHFEDADDSEIIAGGVNMKGIHGVALVREAHRLLWGFIAPPSDMTVEARDVFVNALVWIHQFDGHQQTEFADKHPRTRIKSILDSQYTTSTNLMRWFPQELLDQTGNDKEKLREHFNGRLPFVYVPTGGGQLTVDEDAERLDTPNHSPESLAKWVEMLDGDDAETAKRLLLRYSGKRLRGNRQWREWLEQYKDQLKFSDERGYRFYPVVATDEDSEVATHIKQSDALGLSDVAPVKFDISLGSTRRINGTDYQFKRGKVTLVLRARVKEGWFFYPMTADKLGMSPTSIDVALPSGMSFSDDWHQPVDAGGKLFDGARFERNISVGKPDVELHQIVGRITFQPCTESKCLMPQEREFSLPLKVIPR